MTKIEHYTEELTKNLMEFVVGENDFGYVYPQGNLHDIQKIEDLLKNAGGKPNECDLHDYYKGGNGKALPEYVMTFKDDTNTILIIECKKDIKKHKSQDLNKPSGYAVDGALYYTKFLKSDYNVIAIGISGTEIDTLRLDVFYWSKGQESPLEQKKLKNIFLTPLNYLRAIKGEKISKKYSLDEIRETAIDFHNKLRNLDVSEKQKPMFIAGILIALENPDFCREYINYTSFDSVIRNLNGAIEAVLDKSDIKKDKIAHIKSSFLSIGNNEKLRKKQLGTDNSITWYIEQLEMKIKPMMNYADSSLDALGVFYHEFVKYSGGDGKGLGIVLTPQHLTEFMCELADINQNSYVVDICCGSGSFLVSAMSLMFAKTSDPAVLNNIRKNQLYGIEFQTDLYVLAIANMIIRKDGKSNILQGDCFDSKIIEELKTTSQGKLNVGLLNPPYSKKDKGEEELKFVAKLLSLLSTGGKAVVVVPMSCAIGTKFKETRRRLFEKHTLRAVFSMPDDIFYPTAATNVCVMVFEAHKPHDSTVKTFFGYYKDDGFVKRKKLGRVDAFGRWQTTKNDWLQLYRNSEVLDGISSKHAVNHNDEWLCEAYMQTDYTNVCEDDFRKSIKEYLAYLIINDDINLDKNNFDIKFYRNKNIFLNVGNWKSFTIGELFTLIRGKRLKSEDRIIGNVKYFSASEINNGLTDKISNPLFIENNSIIYTTFGDAFYVNGNFTASDEITIFKHKNLNIYNGLFIATILKMNKFKYQFGRKAFQNKFKDEIIKLPATPNNTPDWVFMEYYIKSLPYSDKI